MLPETSDEARQAAALRAFLEPEDTTIGALDLRPVTLGSLSLLRQTKNEFVAPAGPIGADGQPTFANEIFAALAFAYVHVGDLKEVRRAAYSPSLFLERVLDFGDQLAPGDLPRLMAEITRRLNTIQTLQFGVEAKPDDYKTTGPEPTGNS